MIPAKLLGNTYVHNTQDTLRKGTTLTQTTQTFTVVDPRTFDGDPYEVAARACQKAEALTKLSAKAAEWASIMARNAELSRQDDGEGRMNVVAWEDSVQGRKFAGAHRDLKKVERDFQTLTAAAGFNPKKAR